jgi:hypothetical protein
MKEIVRILAKKKLMDMKEDEMENEEEDNEEEDSEDDNEDDDNEKEKGKMNPMDKKKKAMILMMLKSKMK